MMVCCDMAGFGSASLRTRTGCPNTSDRLSAADLLQTGSYLVIQALEDIALQQIRACGQVHGEEGAIWRKEGGCVAGVQAVGAGHRAGQGGRRGQVRGAGEHGVGAGALLRPHRCVEWAKKRFLRAQHTVAHEPHWPVQTEMLLCLRAGLVA